MDITESIEFRGYHVFETPGQIVTSGWVYGYYFKHFGADRHSIYLNDGRGSRIVYKESVGRFTGLHDKNGKKIWEGDIVKCSYGIGKVYYNTITGAFMVEWIDDLEANVEFLGLERKARRTRQESDEVFEIVGNIFEHPELLNNEMV